jgi:chemotaxis protein methyltransferase CheR
MKPAAHALHDLTPELSPSEFERLSRLIYDRSGIHLNEHKHALVRARLGKRLRALKLPSFKAYLQLLSESGSEGVETIHLLDAISTNLTEFFREPRHFEYLAQTFFPRWKDEPVLRILSAGCSTGEEPYTIALCAREFFGLGAAKRVRILAGDLSTRVLAIARKGVYSAARLRHLPAARVKLGFLKGTGSSDGLYAVAPELRELVSFRRLNLLQLPELGTHFHAIFCRNVTIYFDRPTQQGVFRSCRDRLLPGGTFFLGHSESMLSQHDGFRYVQPTVYERCGGAR